jgi:hypothetical protein
MNNPVHISKNGMVLPIDGLGHIEPPFQLVCPDGKYVDIRDGDVPIYFARNRVRIVKGKVVSKFLHRYCMGVQKVDGSIEKNWLFSDGRFDVTGEKPSE